jgi:hypothetical protein
MSENPLQKWRESLQQKYGNPERPIPYNYEYQEWRERMKNMLASFQEEIEIQIRRTKEEYELDYQKVLQFSKEKERNKENVENKENSKKREM